MAERPGDWFASMFLPAARTFQEPQWKPLADICRTCDGYVVKFDLAGIRPQDIEVRASGRRLTLQGVRHDTLSRESAGYVSLEISYSRFERCVELPCELDDAAITTEYHDGMLVLRIHTSN